MAKNKANRWIRISMVTIILGSIGAGAYIGYPFYQLYIAGNEKNVNLASGEKAFVFIPTSADLEAVISVLHGGQIINDVDGFRKVAIKKNYQGKNIVAGKYEITGDMTNNDLINHLRAGNGRLEVTVIIDNLHTLEALCEKATEGLEMKKEVLLAYITSDSILAKYGFDKRSVFALFLPDTYKMDWALSPQDFVLRMAKEYKDFWNESRRQKAADLGLSQTQVATLASIVMMEQGKHRDEWPTIAGLYLNRVKKKIKLQSDPTVKYAWGDMTMQRVKNLSIDSPYNTYKYTGIPPSPIIMASREAMDAVLNAENHNHIYMCAKADMSGRHLFTASDKEHARNAAAYHKALDARGIK